MSEILKPWSEMTAKEKRDAVKPLILAGHGYVEIGNRLGAPHRNCIAGVVDRLRKVGELPPAQSKRHSGAAGGAIIKAKARKRREKQHIPTPEVQARPPVRVKPAAKTAKIIALPSAASPSVTAAAIESYIAANGVRRFERGATDDLDYLRAYVGRHGYEIAYTQRGFTPYQIRGGDGRPRNLTRSGLFAFVDDLRIADGLEPFIPREERAHA